ncbi:MAG: hypothetical protein A2X11_15355 [Bacteroidetes bacterium GWE2_42_24]|nr:MAG: hypothetical protein A2X11_15355 [Bacteroidetes bacterium GWE2_42_24]OFY31718.1 MAG: hypothetical protein A2X09_09100 [Bacteroidetes bacterium GWF2_43_11]
MKIMRQLLQKTVLLVAISALIWACDKVDEPYLSATNNPQPVTNTQKVLLEEFTGHKCTNCPKAHLEAKNIQLLNPGRVIVVSIHAGFFASPDGSGLFTADYRTDEGTEINTAFGVESNPTGMINRTKFNDKFLQGTDSWQGYVESALAKTLKATITLPVEWNSSTRSLTINPSVKFLEEVSGKYNICVVITEDSLNSPQKNTDISAGTVPTIDPYYHRHVLRKAVNGVWGESLNSNDGIAGGTTLSKSYTFVLPDSWDEDHCSVVAYVSRMDEVSEKYSVLQVEETHVVESK